MLVQDGAAPSLMHVAAQHWVPNNANASTRNANIRLNMIEPPLVSPAGNSRRGQPGVQKTEGSAKQGQLESYRSPKGNLVSPLLVWNRHVASVQIKPPQTNFSFSSEIFQQPCNHLNSGKVMKVR